MLRIGRLLLLFAMGLRVASGQTIAHSSYDGWARSGSPYVKLLAADPSVADGFGHSVAVSGDIAVVGVRFDDDRGMDAGAAYIFRFDGSSWAEEQKLTASDGSAGDAFGWEVSISGELIAVAAPGDDSGGTDAGSVYVFRYNGASWIEEQRLFAPDAAGRDGFGTSVAIDGSVAAVGVPYDDDGFTDAGSAFVFRHNGSAWVVDQKLTAPDGAGRDYFGSAVSLSGNAVLVGSPLADGPAADAGAAYYFRDDGNTWIFEQRLTGSQTGQSDEFGSAISSAGDRAVVGAYSSNDSGIDSGSAYVFHFDGSVWQEETKLTASDAFPGDLFGIAVSLSGETVVVGAWGNDNVGPNAGAAYVYRHDGLSWQETETLIAPDGSAGDLFGTSVAVDGTTIIVGATGNDEMAVDAGAAYAFVVTATSTDWRDTTPKEVEVRLRSHPDPFSRSTMITFEIPPGSHGELDIFDTLGRQATPVAHGRFEDGKHAFTLSGDELASGVYFIRLSTEGGVTVHPIHVIH